MGTRTQTCYSPYIFGFVLGELIRRTTGRLTSEYFAAEFARPAGIDFHFGLQDRSMLERVADLIFADNPNPPLEGLAARVWFSVRQDGLEVWKGWESWEQRSAEIPAANGYGNARSMARAGAILAMHGELDGRRYLSPETVALAATEQTYSECPMLGMVRMGLGLGLHSEEFPAPTPTAVHWGGYGGSLLVMDPRIGVSFAYAPNNLVVGDEFRDDVRIARLWMALTDIMTGI